jgi:CubicO group peptidase (beta-lactamase class C family)
MAQSAKLSDQFKPPDQEGVYTNLNYFILGGIVARITGQDVGQVITTNIIHKLGLRHTTYPTQEDLRGGLHGYGWNPQTGRFDDKTRFNPALGGPAGAMISNLTDLERYVRVLCRGGLLKPQTQRARMRVRRLLEQRPSMARASSPSQVSAGTAERSLGLVRICKSARSAVGYVSERGALDDVDQFPGSDDGWHPVISRKRNCRGSENTTPMPSPYSGWQGG